MGRSEQERQYCKYLNVHLAVGDRVSFNEAVDNCTYGKISAIDGTRLIVTLPCGKQVERRKYHLAYYPTEGTIYRRAARLRAGRIKDGTY